MDIDRRQLLKSLGAAGALSGFAGCTGGPGGDGGDGGDGGGGELGERVPTIVLEFWAGLGGATRNYENQVPTLQNNWSELGVSMEARGETYTTMMSDFASGDLQRNLSFFLHGQDPTRVDPDEMLKRFGIHRAGNTGLDNPANYTNCEYTDLSFKQSTEGDPEKRLDLIHEAIKMRSSDYYTIPTLQRPVSGAWNSDKVEIGGVGDMGVGVLNSALFRMSTPKEGDSFVINVNSTSLQSKNYLTVAATPALMLFNRIVNQTLTQYDQNFELQNILAESIEQENGGRDVTVSIRDATFHNGDTITAEDVKFTFDLIHSNPGSFPAATDPIYQEIEIIDEKTVRFTGERPDVVLTTRRFPSWGILHSESWREAGVVENPGEAYPDEIIGSGIFQVENFTADQAIRLSPHDGHPLYGEDDAWTPEHEVIGAVFNEQEAYIQAFLNEDLHIYTGADLGVKSRLTEPDWGNFRSIPGWTSLLMYVEMAKAPTKFSAFRQALGMAINRQRLNQLVYNGASSPSMWSELWEKGHPFLPPEDELTWYTHDPTGDIEGARQVLKDAGWGWDDQDRLHYPPDADLSPVFPQGGRPSPEDFECMEEVNGKSVYVRPNGEPYTHS